MALPAFSQVGQAVTRTQRAAKLHGIYAIVNETASPNPIELTRAILEGGARIVQYRAKSGIVPDHLRAMRELTRAHEALLMLNDDWRAVQAYDADGVHVGPGDAQPDELAPMRAALPDRLIGISCGTPEEARFAEAIDADYIGVGCVYATNSKADAGEPIGVAGLSAVAAATRLPAAAIGGITLEHLQDVRASGAAMAAVISAIANANDPKAATHDLVGAWSSR